MADNEGTGVNPIRRAREAAGLSQTDVTRLTGIAQTMLSRLENGHTSIDKTTVGTIRKLADALGVTIDELTAQDKGE